MILECIPEYQNAENWAELAEKYGLNFEYNEFFNPAILEDDGKIEEIVKVYKGIGRDMSRDTLHGAFLDITVSSSDPLIRKASDYRVSQSIEISRMMGIRGCVFHTNYLAEFKSVTYRDAWVNGNIAYWTEKCEKNRDIDIYLENMFDDTPELLRRVAEEMKEIPNFGVCLDLAHAFLSDASVKEWVDDLAGYVKHIHLNDNDGIQDLHLPVGEGKMDWKILKEKKLFARDPSVLIEVSGMERLNASYHNMREMRFI